MAWGYRRSANRTRPLWRTLIDAAVFAAALLLVVFVLDRLDVMQLGTGGYQVVDGDSLRRGETEVRLVGIDAPEHRQSCRDENGLDYACGREAAKALRQLVRAGDVQCESHSIDRYGRALATCQAGRLNINREMVRLGWAVAYVPHGLAFRYKPDEIAAQANKRGLWRGRFEMPEDYRARTRVSEGSVGGAEPED